MMNDATEFNKVTVECLWLANGSKGDRGSHQHLAAGGKTHLPLHLVYLPQGSALNYVLIRYEGACTVLAV
jgi:hypothetical protein